MNLTWKRRMEQIRQRWWVVAVVDCARCARPRRRLSLPAHPTYVGKSTLVLSGRAPEQDAVMVLGYVTIFNDPATIARLRTTAKIPEDVTLRGPDSCCQPDPDHRGDRRRPESRAGCSGGHRPRRSVLYINAVPQSGRENYVAELERQLAEIPPVDPDGSANPYYATLQERIDDAAVQLDQ